MSSNIDFSVIGRNIRKFREGAGLLQAKFAEDVGISTTHLSNIENGAPVSLSTLIDISRELHVDANSITGSNIPYAMQLARDEKLLRHLSEINTADLERSVELMQWIIEWQKAYKQDG